MQSIIVSKGPRHLLKQYVPTVICQAAAGVDAALELILVNICRIYLNGCRDLDTACWMC